MASSNPSSSRKRQAAEDLTPSSSVTGPRHTYADAIQFERAHDNWNREWSEHGMPAGMGVPMYPPLPPVGYHMWPMPMGHMMPDHGEGSWMVPPPPPPPSSTPPKASSSPSLSAPTLVPPPSPARRQGDEKRGTPLQDADKKEKKDDEQPADRSPQDREMPSAKGKDEKKDEAAPAMDGPSRCHRFPRFPHPDAVPRPPRIPYRGNSQYIRPPIIPLPSMYGQHHLRPLNMSPAHPVGRKRGPRNSAPSMVTPMYPMPTASPSMMMATPMNPVMVSPPSNSTTVSPPSNPTTVDTPKATRRPRQRKDAPEPTPPSSTSPPSDMSPVITPTVSEANNDLPPPVPTHIVKSVPLTDTELMPPPPIPRNISRFTKMELLEKIFLINPSPTIDQFCIVSEICEIPQKELIRWYAQRRGRDNKVPVAASPAPTKKLPKPPKATKANANEVDAATITTAQLHENPELSNVVLAEMTPTMAAVIIRIKKQVMVELSADIDGLRREVRELSSNVLSANPIDPNFGALNELVAQLVKDANLTPADDPSEPGPSSSEPSQPSSSTDVSNMPSPEEIVEFFNNFLMNQNPEVKPDDAQP
uniref:Homeobox domain-containing protein n=1 Tax=Panagrellus redivivus TaxID=6233 RepID=A0A7E4UMS1_PANRE